MSERKCQGCGSTYALDFDEDKNIIYCVQCKEINEEVQQEAEGIE